MTVKLVEGDVLVCGSDGVFDNLRVSRICELGSDGGTPERIAKGIAEEVS